MWAILLPFFAVLWQGGSRHGGGWVMAVYGHGYGYYWYDYAVRAVWGGVGVIVGRWRNE